MTHFSIGNLLSVREDVVKMDTKVQSFWIFQPLEVLERRTTIALRA